MLAEVIACRIMPEYRLAEDACGATGRGQEHGIKVSRQFFWRPKKTRRTTDAIFVLACFAFVTAPLGGWHLARLVSIQDVFQPVTALAGAVVIFTGKAITGQRIRGWAVFGAEGPAFINTVARACR